MTTQPIIEVRLVQSFRFPNVWSLACDDDTHSRIFRDTLFANGAIAAESAVIYAREHELRIVAIDYDDEREIIDPRTGRTVDPAREVIAGIEYRTRQPVLDEARL